MALANLTEVPKQTSYEELICATEFTRGVHNHLIVISMLNGFVAITAFLGNTLILVALHKETSLHAPSKLLLRSLATTDLCVGLIVEPFGLTFLILSLKERKDICRYIRICYFQYHKSYFVFSIFVYTDRHKRGQTSRPVIRTQIQTSCNFEANISNCSCFLGCPLCRNGNVTLE